MVANNCTVISLQLDKCSETGCLVPNFSLARRRRPDPVQAVRSSVYSISTVWLSRIWPDLSPTLKVDGIHADCSGGSTVERETPNAFFGFTFLVSHDMIMARPH